MTFTERSSELHSIRAAAYLFPSLRDDLYENFLTRSLLLEMRLQPRERIVPAGGDQIQVPARFSEPGWIQRPDLLASLTGSIDDAGRGEDVQMLGDALPRDRRDPLGQRRDRSG